MSLVVFVGIGVVVIVLFVGAVFVVRESARMDRQPPSRPFDMEEAVDWVVQHISDEAAATLTLDDVELIIELQLEYFSKKGVSGNGHGNDSDAPVVVGGSETVEYIVRRAAERGQGFIPEQVHAVVETQITYLRSIGVIGPRADESPGDV